MFSHISGKLAERGKSYEIQTVDRVTSPHCGVKKLKKKDHNSQRVQLFSEKKNYVMPYTIPNELKTWLHLACAYIAEDVYFSTSSFSIFNRKSRIPEPAYTQQ